MESHPQFHGRPLFSFGTLQDEDVFRTITGTPIDRAARTSEGRIEGHAAHGVLDGLYPVLVPSPGAAAAGTLFHDLAPAALDRLIWFEWPEFVPDVISVATADGAVESTYFRPARAPAPSDRPWSLAEWRRTRKADWLDHARKAMHFHGVVDSRTLDRYWDAILRRLSGEAVELPPEIAARCDELGRGAT